MCNMNGGEGIVEPLPVTAVTFAAPRVGDNKYASKFGPAMYARPSPVHTPCSHTDWLGHHCSMVVHLCSLIAGVITGLHHHAISIAVEPHSCLLRPCTIVRAFACSNTQRVSCQGRANVPCPQLCVQKGCPRVINRLSPYNTRSSPVSMPLIQLRGLAVRAVGAHPQHVCCGRTRIGLRRGAFCGHLPRGPGCREPRAVPAVDVGDLLACEVVWRSSAADAARMGSSLVRHIHKRARARQRYCWSQETHMVQSPILRPLQGVKRVPWVLPDGSRFGCSVLSQGVQCLRVAFLPPNTSSRCLII